MTVQWSSNVRDNRNDAWQLGSVQGSQGNTAAWAQSTGYTALTSWIQNGGKIYLCTTTGTSASSGTGPSGTGSNITDGTCHWTYIGNQAIGISAILNVYTGAQPSSCAATETGTLLVSFALAANYASASSGGIKSLSGLPIAATAGNTGAAGHYRIMDALNTTCHEQGSITATGGGGDATIDNTAITNLQTVNLTSFSMTEPGA
jgi:hypothetical protein